jgi:hypothetical protein
MSDHDGLCPWVVDPHRGPGDMCAWCDVIRRARADATMVADAMLVQAKILADESQEALAAAIRIIMELRNDIADTAARHGMPPDVVARFRGKP